MKLTFLGTRGYLDVHTRRHRMHAALLVTHRRTRVMVDCGEDWLGRLGDVDPDAIVVTHGHPDHAGGLREGVSCPLYATRDGWRALEHAAISPRHRRVVRPRMPVRIGGLAFEAFPVAHSLRAPAVGYRIAAGDVVLFYAPDVLSILTPRAALRGVQLYVGDGASITRPIVHRRPGAAFGHAAIGTQLAWCGAWGVPRAVFTHCGTQIVSGSARKTAARVAALGQAQGVEASVAHDGLEMTLRGRRPALPAGAGFASA